MARAYTKVGEKVAAAKFGIQATLILSEMSETEPRTVTQITNRIVPRLVTRQDPERVTAFYVSVWKKKGIVRLHEVSDTGEVRIAHTASAQVAHAEPAGPTPSEIAESTSVPQAGPGELPNLSGMKLSAAVLEVIKFRSGSAAADQILATLNAHGYEFKLNQVNSALQALEARQAVSRKDDGVYDLV